MRSGTSSATSSRTRRREALALFDVIQSVDSLALAQRLDRLLADGARCRRPGAAERFPVYLQVNVDADPAKEGFLADELGRGACLRWRGCPGSSFEV